MDDAYLEANYEKWETCHALFPYVEAAINHRPVCKRYLEHRSSVLFEAAWYARKTGRNDQSEIMYRHGLEGAEKALGPEHPDTLASMSELARTLIKQEK